ncbi:hypothetical protein EDB85DRAFT_2142292 [Lactarius pseudohatsudake]|nr:hypothetical protein EDB85DRAFT_2142292 [Lactarius pseudohatsudake]
MAAAYSSKTISNYLNSICTWHILHSVPWVLDKKEMDTMLQAANKLALNSSRRKKHQLYTPNFIAAIRQHLNLENLLNTARDYTVASLRIELEEGDSWTRVQRRQEDDLPSHVLGIAFWDDLEDEPTEGYFLVYQGKTYTVELINNAWYFLRKDAPYYYTRQDHFIAHENTIGLGYWNLDNPQHPKNDAEAAELPPAVPPKEILVDVPEFATEVDVLTAVLPPIASLQGPLPLAADAPAPVILPHIATAIASGSRPIVLTSAPIAPTITPTVTSTAPNMASGTGSTPSSGGKLSGNAPRVFDGARDKSKTFVREFDLYRGMNEDAEIMKSPYQHVFLALSFIRRPNVDDWVNGQLADIHAKVAGSATTAAILKNTESLWNDFTATFKSAFTNATEKQDAYQALKTHQMKGSELDTYTAVFRNLAAKAGYALDAAATVDLYSGGLPRSLLSAILRRDTTPKTFDQWVTAVQTEQRKYAMLRARVGLGGGEKRVARKTKNNWRQILMPSGNDQRRPTSHAPTAPAARS